MAIVVVRKKPTKEAIEIARKDYDTYIKITIDLGQELIALGGEYHADAEALLLKQGAKQKDIWGGGINLEEKRIETNAIINLRPGQNESTEILDLKTRNRFIKMLRKIFKDYV